MSSTSTAVLPSAGEWLAHLRREASRFVEVAARSPLQVHVPSYPAFTVETLSAHIGRVLRAFQATVSAGSSSPQDQVIQAPTGQAIVGWVQAGLEPLLTSLSQVPPDQPVTFPHDAGDRPAALIAPLLAVEVGVHRWDLESVLGEHDAIPPDLAAREVDSVIENFIPRLASTGVTPIGGTVRLRATDAPVGWDVFVQDGRLLAGRLAGDEPDDAAVVVSAPAEDLALIVWKRRPPPRPGVDVSGSVDVLKRFLSTDYIPDPRTTPAH